MRYVASLRDNIRLYSSRIVVSRLLQKGVYFCIRDYFSNNI